MFSPTLNRRKLLIMNLPSIPFQPTRIHSRRRFTRRRNLILLRLKRGLILLLLSGALMSTTATSLTSPPLRARPTASSVTATALQDVNLKALIDGVLARYSRMRGLEADFTQLYISADGRALRESGHLTLKRPRKARWDYQQPEQKLFISDGKTIYFYVTGERQATRTSIKESADPQIPFLFLLDQNTLARERGSVEIASHEKPIGAGNIMLKLSPRRATKAFKQLLIEVAPVSFEVRRLVILERSGARMDFTLSNVRENVVAPDGRFQFIAPPGITIQQAQ